ncbi:hypothetical protein ACFLIM_31635 [Nonomuraea sp. M3C6]|uniref:Secreted protein n=1 Tax=Nonomuraea marmarensis TaxID=3351344 RepID=A0ABW7ANH8_9ACTN
MKGNLIAAGGALVTAAALIGMAGPANANPRVCGLNVADACNDLQLNSDGWDRDSWNRGDWDGNGWNPGGWNPGGWHPGVWHWGDWRGNAWNPGVWNGHLPSWGWPNRDQSLGARAV